MEIEKISGSPRDVEQAFGIPTKTLAQLRWQSIGDLNTISLGK